MKPICVISCPIDTFSGYGARSRDFVKGLIQVTISGELGEEATVPSELGFKVIDNKISKEKKQRIEDKMAGDSEDIEDKEDKEVSSDLPVKIESVQNKHKILEAIKRNAL